MTGGCTGGVLVGVGEGSAKSGEGYLALRKTESSGVQKNNCIQETLAQSSPNVSFNFKLAAALCCSDLYAAGSLLGHQTSNAVVSECSPDLDVTPLPIRPPTQ